MFDRYSLACWVPVMLVGAALNDLFNNLMLRRNWLGVIEAVLCYHGPPRIGPWTAALSCQSTLTRPECGGQQPGSVKINALLLLHPIGSPYALARE